MILDGQQEYEQNESFSHESTQLRFANRLSLEAKFFVNAATGPDSTSVMEGYIPHTGFAPFHGAIRMEACRRRRLREREM